MPLSQELLIKLQTDDDVTISLSNIDEADIKKITTAIAQNDKLSTLIFSQNHLPANFFYEIAIPLIIHPTLTNIMAEANLYNSQPVNIGDPIEQDPKVGEQFIKELANRNLKVNQNTLKIKKLLEKISATIQTAADIVEISLTLNELKKSLTTIYNLATEMHRTLTIKTSKDTEKNKETKKSALKKENDKVEAGSITINLNGVHEKLKSINIKSLNEVIKILNEKPIIVQEIEPFPNAPIIIKENKGKKKIKIDGPADDNTKSELIRDFNGIITNINQAISFVDPNKTIDTTRTLFVLITTIKDIIFIVEEVTFIDPADIIEDITQKMAMFNAEMKSMLGLFNTEAFCQVLKVDQNNQNIEYLNFFLKQIAFVFNPEIQRLEEQKTTIKKLFIDYLLIVIPNIQSLKLTGALDNTWLIDEKDCERITKCLSENPNLAFFRLNHTAISEEKLIVLAKQLLDHKKFPQLFNIDLSNNQLGNDFLTAVSKLLLNHPTLKQFSLKNNHADSTTLIKFLKDLTKNNFYIINIDIANKTISIEEKNHINTLQNEFSRRNSHFNSNRPNLLETYRLGSQLLGEISSQEKLAAENLTIIQGIKNKQTTIETLEESQVDKFLIEKPLYPFELALRSSKAIHENLQLQLKQSHEIMRKSLFLFIGQASKIESPDILSKLAYMKAALVTLQEQQELIDKNNTEQQTVLLNFFKQAILTVIYYQYDILSRLSGNVDQKAEESNQTADSQKFNSTQNERAKKKAEAIKKEQTKIYQEISDMNDIYSLYNALNQWEIPKSYQVQKEDEIKKVTTKKTNKDTKVHEQVKEEIKDPFASLKMYIEQIIETMQPFVTEPPKETKKQGFAKSLGSAFFTSKKNSPDKSIVDSSATNSSKKSTSEEVVVKKEFRDYSRNPNLSSYPKALFSDSITETAKSNPNQVSKKKNNIKFNPDVKELYSYYPTEEDEPPFTLHEEKKVNLDELDREHETAVYPDYHGQKTRANVPGNTKKLESLIDEFVDAYGNGTKSNQP